MIQDLVVYTAYIVYAIAVLMGFGIILTWVERKQSAVMSDRIGANRAYIRLPFTQIKLVWLGLFHGMADGLKMLLKEDFKPKTYDWYAYAVAPWVVFTPVLLVFAVIPFGPGVTIDGRHVPGSGPRFTVIKCASAAASTEGILLPGKNGRKRTLPVPFAIASTCARCAPSPTKTNPTPSFTSSFAAVISVCHAP